MAPKPRKVTYRVRQIPSHCSQFHEVAKVLSYVLNYHDVVHVHSLASSIDCFDKPATKVATVTFAEQPTALAHRDRVEWIFSRSQTSLSHNIIVDTHFRGFTVLNEVEGGKLSLNCIAATGLGGHAFGSWSSRDDESTLMWLRDAVPRYFPQTRVLSYGYDSRLLDSESFRTISKISLAFITKMRSLELTERSVKPILFVGHSLGGIVVKEAVVQMAGSPTLEMFLLPKIVKTILFGVPNRGMRVSHLLSMVKHQPNESLITSLRENSPYLAELDEQFYGVSLTAGIETISVYETHKSQTPKEESNGSWTPRTGPYEILVEPKSAIQRGTKEMDQYPVNRDHSGLVKFTENDDVLGPILHFMRVSHKVPGAIDRKGNLSASGSSTSVTNDIRLQSMLEVNENQLLVEVAEAFEFVLQSIGAEETDLRYRAVESAYCSTFDWVFETNKVGLVEWLKRGTGIFWVNGKPGSGKSTVMKHIYQNYTRSSKTVRRAEFGWRDITAKFFFFQRGTEIQKSLEGLLRSTLHQILSNTAEVAYELMLSLFGKEPLKSNDLSLNQLDAAWDQLLAQRVIRLRITLFLDALDEFDGPPEKIARFLERTTSQPSTSWTHVRICFASRPWDAFNDRFSHCHGFQMEKHTARDIEIFINGSMYGHSAMRIFLNSSDETERFKASQLISGILKHARGVFIWVKLVLENILEARTEGAELEELNDIIAQLPQELEDLYTALLLRVKSQAHRREAYAMLELLVRLPRAPTLHEFRSIVKCAVLTDLEECVTAMRQLNPQMSDTDIDTLRRRIKSRCGGLLEIVRLQSYEKDGEFILIVQFMHQTVKDFVTRPGFKNLFDLAESAILSENGHSFIAKFALTMINGIQVGPEGCRNRVWWFDTDQKMPWFSLCVNAFRQAEVTTGFSQKHLLDSISDDQFAAFFPQERYHADLQAIMDYHPREWPIDSRLAFAIMVRLQIYCEDVVRSMSEPVVSQGIPILHLIVEKVHHDTQNLLTMDCCDRSEYARLLLSHGADVGPMHEGLTPFQALFRCSNPLDPPTDFGESMGRMAELLLEYGSDPNAYMFYAFDNIESFLIRPATFTSKPLNISIRRPLLLRLLLGYGANVNGLDRSRQTALDTIAYWALRGWGGYVFNDPYAWKSAAILVREGGRATRASITMERGPAYLDYQRDQNGDDYDDERPYERPQTNVLWRSRLNCLSLVCEDDEVKEYCRLAEDPSSDLLLSVCTMSNIVEYPNLILPNRRS